MLGAACGPAQAETRPLSNRYEALREQDLRVAKVTYRLSVANRRLCRGALAPQLGFVLHSIGQYGSGDRAEAARAFGLGDHFGVMAVVAGSPAAKAGLTADDQLVSVNGRELGGASVALTGAPARALVDRAQGILVEELSKGEISLRILRAGNPRDLRFAAEIGCRSDVELIPDGDVNAWADGGHIVIAAGLLRRCATDEDLALVIAHELAHNILHHGRRLALAGATRGPRPGLTGSELADMQQMEMDADRLAIGLVSGAAYDLSGAEAFLAGLLRDNAGPQAAATHPLPERRLGLLRAGIAAAGITDGGR